MTAAPDHAPRAALGLVRDALRALRATWIPLARADLLFRIISFAVLTPVVTLFARFLIARSGERGLADVDIAMYFFTTPIGIVAFLLILALVVCLVTLEQACLVTIAVGSSRGVALRARDGFAHAIAQSLRVLRLAFNLVVRVILLTLPFAAALGIVYWALLTTHDINFYLTDRPPAFWLAAATGGLIALALGITLAKRVTAWVLALPIVLFEPVLPLRSFGESTTRMSGRRRAAFLALAAWAVTWTLLPWLARHGLRFLGRALGPLFADSMAGLLLFISVLAIVALIVSLAIGIAGSVVLAQLVGAFYVDAGHPAELKMPAAFRGELEVEGRRLRVSWPIVMTVVVLAVVGGGFLARYLMRITWATRPVLIIAHRGSSIEAPENSLAAFALAGKEHADFVELDVQETADGIVVVNHDVDLMKVARSPLKIWESSFAQLRTVDIGSYRGPQYADQRVPTLAEALAVCRGVTKVNIELKDYGHDVRLEERVAAIVDSMGMADQIVTMSLNPKMVEEMKRIRPTWTSGLLAAKTVGYPSTLPGDFLAVQAGIATRSYIRAVHGAKKPLYVWTVDDPQQMLRLIGLGADGLITNKPAVARDAVGTYQGLSEPQRLYVFMMTRLGAREEIVEEAHDIEP